MTRTEIKAEIQKTLENVPENILRDVLELLRDLQKQPSDQLKTMHSLRRIIAEDKELLQMLAQ